MRLQPLALLFLIPVWIPLSSGAQERDYYAELRKAYAGASEPASELIQGVISGRCIWEKSRKLTNAVLIEDIAAEPTSAGPLFAGAPQRRALVLDQRNELPDYFDIASPSRERIIAEFLEQYRYRFETLRAKDRELISVGRVSEWNNHEYSPVTLTYRFRANGPTLVSEMTKTVEHPVDGVKTYRAYCYFFQKVR
jgi:hypothetical protein